MAKTIFDHRDAEQMVLAVESPLISEPLLIEQPILDLPWNAPTPEGFVKGEQATDAALRERGAFETADAEELNALRSKARSFFVPLRQQANVAHLEAAGKVARLYLVPPGSPVPLHPLDQAAGQ